MKWEEYQKTKHELKNKILIEVQCPICGNYIYKKTDIILTCYPPKYYYECNNCGWSSSGY